MTTLVKKTRSRLVRWFKKIKEQNKSPYKCGTSTIISAFSQLPFLISFAATAAPSRFRSGRRCVFSALALRK